jgi:hypothetical protein
MQNKKCRKTFGPPGISSTSHAARFRLMYSQFTLQTNARFIYGLECYKYGWDL